MQIQEKEFENKIDELRSDIQTKDGRLDETQNDIEDLKEVCINYLNFSTVGFFSEITPSAWLYSPFPLPPRFYLPPPPSVLRPTRNLLEESFNEIDTVVNSFGDENIVSCPNPNPLLPLQSSSHSPRQLGSAFSQTINLEKSFSLN